jgi:ribosomal protein S17
VASAKLDNGIVVALDTWYRKIMSKTKRYLVYDPHNTCKIGNVVVKEHSPLSAKKLWS